MANISFTSYVLCVKLDTVFEKLYMASSLYTSDFLLGKPTRVMEMTNVERCVGQLPMSPAKPPR